MPVPTRILAFDLETSNLKGNFGHILVACAKWVGETEFALSMRIDEQKGYGKTAQSFINDKPIVEKLVKLMGSADALVAHYGDDRRFDKPFLTTRALVHNLQPPPPVKFIDTWKYAYVKLALTSNRLETISHALGCQHTKYKLPMEAWQLAMHGDKETLTQMQQYCENDVNTLIDVYLRLRPVIHDHPNVTGASLDEHGFPTSCKACTTQPVRFQARGFMYTKTTKTARFQCQNCYSWSQGRQTRT
jgi:uncharacterized protein YprB with RNaseH-like and TPR domain